MKDMCVHKKQMVVTVNGDKLFACYVFGERYYVIFLNIITHFVSNKIKIARIYFD